MIHLQKQQIESIEEMLRKCYINGKAIRDKLCWHPFITTHFP